MIANPPHGESGRSRRFLGIFALVFAGEIIFSLPFHLPRFFRPTVLDVFQFSNTELGDVFAVYGVTAMLAYLPGGLIADRFSPRTLMTFSLLATGAGGLWLATVPSVGVVAVLYGYWGITTILLFWAAMIRATRAWGGAASQGIAFGILDGGRGFAAAAAATMAVWCLSLFLPEDVGSAGPDEQRAGLIAVIYFYSFITFIAALLIWFTVSRSAPVAGGQRQLAGIGEVLKRREVWAHAGIVVCAYCGYKGLDNYSLYAVQVLGLDEVEGASLSALGSYLRPVGAIAAGLLADRFSASKVITLTFAFLIASYGLLMLADPGQGFAQLVYGNLFVSFLGVFALRGIYFALLEETKTPSRVTGTAVGLVSVIGYTPDVFFAPVTGRILDRTPGAAGFQEYFGFLAAIMVVGLMATFFLIQSIKKRRSESS